MAIIKVVDNTTGEVKEWSTDDEQSNVQEKRKPRKAGSKTPETEQAED
jgi:hypothetical protein